MRSGWVVAVLSVLILVSQASAEEQTALKSQKDKVSYIIGVDIGNNLKRQSVDVDTDLLLKGMKDALAGEKLLLTDEEIRETMTAFSEEMKKKHEDELKKAAEKNKKEGDEFLEGNKKKEGVKTLESGLQYEVLEEGSGASPTADDTVTVNYAGKLLDGTEFDSSYKRGQPATFPVKGVIKGWTEALQLMKEGAKWRLFIPSDLAYGEKGAPPTIGPNAALIFDVELISINKQETPKGHP
jgi:FKBP-type peptidyl-prolyl cis-trans isomerase FklB